MDMPSFGAIQPGDTYCCTPMSVYNLEAAYCALIYNDKTESKGTCIAVCIIKLLLLKEPIILYC